MYVIQILTVVDHFLNFASQCAQFNLPIYQQFNSLFQSKSFTLLKFIFTFVLFVIFHYLEQSPIKGGHFSLLAVILFLYVPWPRHFVTQVHKSQFRPNLYINIFLTEVNVTILIVITCAHHHDWFSSPTLIHHSFIPCFHGHLRQHFHPTSSFTQIPTQSVGSSRDITIVGWGEGGVCITSAATVQVGGTVTISSTKMEMRRKVIINSVNHLADKIKIRWNHLH